MNYNERLNDLFEKEWIESYSEEDRSLFCKDGLILIPGESATFVDEKWAEAPRRIMFIVKDCPDGWGYDVRTILVDEKEGENNFNLSGSKVQQSGFYPNIARMFYGLLKSENGNRGIMNFGAIDTPEGFESVKKTWQTGPIAIVEAKKLAGGKDVSSKDVFNAMKRDEKYLKKEIEILQPNIIVCCDGEDSQFNFITKNYLADEEYIQKEYQYPKTKMICTARYYKNRNVVILRSYHPTSLGKADWMVFERVISPFHALFEDGIYIDGKYYIKK